MHEHTEFSVLNSTSILWECAFVGCKRILCVQVNASELVQLHIFSRIFFVFVLLSSLFPLPVFHFFRVAQSVCVCALRTNLEVFIRLYFVVHCSFFTMLKLNE